MHYRTSTSPPNRSVSSICVLSGSTWTDIRKSNFLTKVNLSFYSCNLFPNLDYSSTKRGPEPQHPGATLLRASPGQVRPVFQLGKTAIATQSDRICRFGCLLSHPDIRCVEKVLRRRQVSFRGRVLQFDDQREGVKKEAEETGK